VRKGVWADFERTGITPATLHEAAGLPSIWLAYMSTTIELPECLMQLCAAIAAICALLSIEMPEGE